MKKDVISRKKHIIDASGRTLGRLASDICILLQGKNKADYAPHKDTGDIVFIKNVEKIKLTGKKIEKKKYHYHTSYPGGLKEVPVQRLIKKNPRKMLQLAVLGMLPKNKLRKRMIQRLKIEINSN